MFLLPIAMCLLTGAASATGGAQASTAGQESGASGRDDRVIEIRGKLDTGQKLQVSESVLSGSRFQNVRMDGLVMENVDLHGARIHDANLSDLEIGDAQLGGALFRHIGLPPPGTPNHVPGAKQRPLRFEECDLSGSVIKSSDLTGVAISGCKLKGMTIDGIPVEEMLRLYRERNTAGAPANR